MKTNKSKKKFRQGVKTTRKGGRWSWNFGPFRAENKLWWNPKTKTWEERCLGLGCLFKKKGAGKRYGGGRKTYKCKIR